VAVDFTVPEDGFVPKDFGLEALWQVLEETAPYAFAALDSAGVESESDRIRERVRPLIYGFGAAAAGAGAVPLPLIGVGGLAGLLALMLQSLARRYGMIWTAATFAQFSGAVGGGALVWWALRYGFREVLKLVPIVGTATAGALNAAAGLAITIGLGQAACVWLGYSRRGEIAPSEEVRRAFAKGLAAGLRQAKEQRALRPEAPNELH
jgi:uncharacterized protein (DUF697 family)